MTPTTIYVKMPVSQELPKQEDFVFCIRANGLHITTYHDGKGFASQEGDFSQYDKAITHWLKPSPLPTDEEIEQMAREVYPTIYFTNKHLQLAYARQTAYSEGMKALRDQLTNKK